MTDRRPQVPPFDLDSAIQRVQAAEDAWNTRDPHHVSLAYTPDSVWRNRDQFLTGRVAIVEFLTAKRERELALDVVGSRAPQPVEADEAAFLAFCPPRGWITTESYFSSC